MHSNLSDPVYNLLFPFKLVFGGGNEFEVPNIQGVQKVNAISEIE